MKFTSTIAAISSSQGEAAIGIVRMSGEKSYEIFTKVFKRPVQNSNGERAYFAFENRHLYYGHIVDPATTKIVDEVMAVYMKAPKTYTREDMVEIYCHGGSISAYRILELLFCEGAVQAEPGEFTLRAFVNGRIDLTQVESITDLVSAKTGRSFDTALSHLQGYFSERIRKAIHLLLDVITQITVAVDYPEEDIEEISLKEIRGKTESVATLLDELIRTGRGGKLLRQGAKLTIVGRPNVGKSSLLNLLLGESRAIVTDVAGTTRDTIEEQVSIKGVPVRLVDTAGIRETEDHVEKIGVERAKLAANDADLIILVLDSSQELTEEEKNLMSVFAHRPLVIILNKTDLQMKWTVDDFKREYAALFKDVEIVPTSMLSVDDGANSRDKIVEAIAKELKVAEISDEFSANARQLALLREARQFVEDSLKSDVYDLIEIDLRAAAESLGKITGDSVSEEIIESIFSNFCLGK